MYPFRGDREPLSIPFAQVLTVVCRAPATAQVHREAPVAMVKAVVMAARAATGWKGSTGVFHSACRACLDGVHRWAAMVVSAPQLGLIHVTTTFIEPLSPF